MKIKIFYYYYYYTAGATSAVFGFSRLIADGKLVRRAYFEKKKN